MDKTIEQIFKTFNHIARELQVYFLSGFVIVVNCLLVDNLYFDSSLVTFIEKHKLIYAVAIIAYIIGHFCMSVYFMAFEITNIEKGAKKILKYNYRGVSSMLPKIYSKDKEMYSHFVERYVLLSNMRATLTAASFINLEIDWFFVKGGKPCWQLNAAILFFSISTLTFFVLTLKTDDEFNHRVRGLNEKKDGDIFYTITKSYKSDTPT